MWLASEAPAAQPGPIQSKVRRWFWKSRASQPHRIGALPRWSQEKKKMDEESWNSVALSAPLGKGHSTHYWRWYSNGMIHFNLALLEFVRILNNYSLSCKVLKMSSAVCVLYHVSITVANVIIQVISPRSVTSAGSYSESLENHRDQNPFPHLILTVI